MTKKFSTYIQILKEEGVDHLNHSVKNEFSYMLKEFAAWKDLSPEEKRQRLKSQGKAGSEQELQQAEAPATYTPQQRTAAMARGEEDPGALVKPAPAQPSGTPAPALPPQPTAPAAAEPPAAVPPAAVPAAAGDPAGTPVAGLPAQDPAAAQAQDPAAAQAPAVAAGGKTQGMLGKVWNHLGGDSKDAADFFPNPEEELQTRVNTSQPNEVKAENLMALATALGIKPGDAINNALPALGSTAQGIVPVGKPRSLQKNPATGGSLRKGSGNAGDMLQQNASVDASGDFISEGKFGNMMQGGWNKMAGSKLGKGVKNAVQNPGEAIKKVGSGIGSLNKVIKNVHNATGGSHGTGGTNISGLMSGEYKGKTSELTTVVNLMAKVLNAKTPNERTTAINNLNSNLDFQEFTKNKTPQEKQAFLQQITSLAQLQ
tara:strand:- start:28337 stop:29623 length:1287 start_codon:yes stop_codon:yes gene_type:complete